MATGHAADHFIPATLHDVRRLLRERAADATVQRSLDLLVSVLRCESSARTDRLKALHDDAMRLRGEATDSESADAIALFDEALSEALRRANYKLLSREDLERAMQSEAVFEVLVHVDLDTFRTLRIYARGRQERTETVSKWWGLRKREVRFEVLDRVFAFVEPKPPSGPTPRANRKRRPVEHITLKLFRAIPLPDLEMILPDSIVRMRKLDKAMILVPASLSIGAALWKVALVLGALLGFGIVNAAQSSEGSSGVNPSVLVVATAVMGLLGVALGAYTKHQKKYLTYANAYADTLYFQTLDSGPGSFLRVLDESFEEEAKEAILAYAFLAQGPRSEADLDDEIETWLGGRIGKTFDFEVDDALAKLQRLGVAERRGDLWHAKPAAVVMPTLLRAWADSAGT